MYTELFSEGHEILAAVAPASHSTEQNARASMADHRRVAIIIHAAASTGAIDVDIEQANAASAGTLKTVSTNAYDVSVAADETLHIIEVRSEVLDTNGGFAWINVEATPAQARVFGILVIGLDPRHKPVDTTLVDEITS